MSSTFASDNVGRLGRSVPTSQLRSEILRGTDELPLREVPFVDLNSTALEDMEREAMGLAPRFAIPNEVYITPDNNGLWEIIDKDTMVWRQRIASKGAISLNLGFSGYYMPSGGRLFIYSPDYSTTLRPFTARDNADHGELWTPVVESDELILEVTVPASQRKELELELTSVNVGYRGFFKDDPLKSGWCNIDVICPEGDAWRDEIASVAVISTGGSLFCTGFMVNNTNEDQTPYFMTANHCGITSNNAASLVAYWNFESPSCGQQGGGSLSEWQSGSYWRAAYYDSDFTLVELDEMPNPAWSVAYAGWSRSGNDASSAVAIHHPSCDEKSISFEYDAVETTSYLGYTIPGDGTHIRVVDWDAGTTEPGSSGSPLFDQNHHVVGQLHGGYAACDNDESDWYGRLSVSWEGGGSSSSRLKDWLDPGNTGVTSLNTLVPGSHYCGDGFCDPDEDECNCPEDCGYPPSIETNCSDGVDEDCDGLTDCEDGDCDGSPDCICDNDGVCESGEDCSNCPNDCFSGSGAVCGNNICETADGEDCASCPQDCNGVQTGKPDFRYCCGDGDGHNPVGCDDPRCSSGGNTCSDIPAVGSCCGDGICEGSEDSYNCAVDCGPAPYCGDGICNGDEDSYSCEEDCGPPPFCGDGICDEGEDQCSCPDDCGYPPTIETNCSDGIDEDCDGYADCDDGDCSADPACSCLPADSPCVYDSECCSNKCLGKPGSRTCK